MKIINKLLKLFFFVVALISCDESDNDISTTTFLPLITINGESSIELDCNVTSFSDPGAIASEGGSMIDLETTINGVYFGSAEVDGPDVYSITYSAINVDGIPGSEFRDILWPPCNGDFVNSIAGVYMSDVDRNSGGEVYAELGPILIIDLGDGVYQISDAIGGFYEFGRGFGSTFAAVDMTVVANDISENDFSHTDIVPVGEFGGELSMTSFSIDAATRTISFTTDWDAGFVFEVILTQQEQ